MTPDAFYEKFDQVVTTPEAVAKMRELVLHLAVTGNLVPQDSSEKPATELLQRACAERALLVAERTIKKRKLGIVEQNEQPFDVPPSWAWARLGEVGHELGQKIPDGRFSYIDVGSIDPEAGTISNRVAELEPGEAPSRARKLVSRGTVVYSTVRPYLRNIAIIDRDFDAEPIASTAFGILYPFAGINSSYLFYWLRSAAFTGYVQGKMKGMAYPAINDEKFYSGFIPLPPLAEQKRIVAKVDELMALCDRLEAQQQERETQHAALTRASLARFADAPTPASLNLLFHKSYTTPPADLRESILELAVHGKLAHQDPSEGTGAQILREAGVVEAALNGLPTLPNHWAWARLGELVTTMNSGWSPACAPEPALAGEWGVLKTTAVQVLRYVEVQNKALPRKLDPRPQNEVMGGDILFTRAGPMNRVGILCVARPTRPRLMLSDKIIRFRLAAGIDPDFAVLSLTAGYPSHFIEELKSGMAASQVNISQPKLKSVPMPVPPLGEQLRIVERVDQLMILVDQLDSQLTGARTLATNLLEAVVAELAA